MALPTARAQEDFGGLGVCTRSGFAGLESAFVVVVGGVVEEMASDKAL